MDQYKEWAYVLQANTNPRLVSDLTSLSSSLIEQISISSNCTVDESMSSNHEWALLEVWNVSQVANSW
jgi:hypothetical protein